RETALRLAERLFAKSESIREITVQLATNPDPRLRFQLALSAGALPEADATGVLASILSKDANDPWTVTAALSSAGVCTFTLTERLIARKEPALLPILSRLAAMTGAKGDDNEIGRVLSLVAGGTGWPAADTT